LVSSRLVFLLLLTPPVSARRPRSSQIEIGGGRPGPKLGPDSAPPPRAREAWRKERLTRPPSSIDSVALAIGLARKKLSASASEGPHRVVASPPSAKLTPWLGRAGHHPIKPKRNRRRRGLQLGHDPAPRSAPPRQGIKSTIPPARNLGARTRRRPLAVLLRSGCWRSRPPSSAPPRPKALSLRRPSALAALDQAK
jgi:hypothetical protein